uniref:Uncharacterized protein n=1 Tax=Trypanosoma congolense (strain IL3000) TaxID=1068625 RepID=F9W8H4_TRYCI|nr:hypothetical protein, unlikely [Trypanosoma congolense IL3000]
MKRGVGIYRRTQPREFTRLLGMVQQTVSSDEMPKTLLPAIFRMNDMVKPAIADRQSLIVHPKKQDHQPFSDNFVVVSKSSCLHKPLSNNVALYVAGNGTQSHASCTQRAERPLVATLRNRTEKNGLTRGIFSSHRDLGRAQ